MRNYTRFIPGEEIGAVEPWSFGAVDTRAVLLAAQVKVQQASAERAQDEALRQEAFAQGFEQGRAHAVVEAQRQMADFVTQQGQGAGQQMARLFEQAQAQLALAEQTLAQGVLEIACELARQVLRRELATDPNSLQPVLREALGLLMADGKSTVVRLNPSDRDTLANGAPNELASLALTLVADPSITPGGCVIESAGTVVDATVQKRWLRAIG
ncbi:MAG: flagellar assembly protein FliH, partial [Betaproteobacteria bacterium]|nr:flagellar assembly protein FliH [Betaproteobacteria bacterium]